MREVLVAETDPSIRLLVTRVLSRGGYAVTAVADGLAALAALRESGDRRFAAAVLGGRLSGLTGTQVAAAARSVQPGLPVVLVTGGGEVPGSTAPHTRRLNKPFGPDELLQAVAEAAG